MSFEGQLVELKWTKTRSATRRVMGRFLFMISLSDDGEIFSDRANDRREYRLFRLWRASNS